MEYPPNRAVSKKNIFLKKVAISCPRQGVVHPRLVSPVSEPVSSCLLLRLPELASLFPSPPSLQLRQPSSPPPAFSFHLVSQPHLFRCCHLPFLPCHVLLPKILHLLLNCPPPLPLSECFHRLFCGDKGGVISSVYFPRTSRTSACPSAMRLFGFFACADGRCS